MNWYYAKEGKQVGPVGEDEFESSVRSGVVTRETLVWREGLEQWVAYGELAGGSPVAVADGGPGAMSLCTECGGSFAQEEMVRFGENWVCAGCKTQHVQKLKEGVAVDYQFGYAGFWIRFGAKVIDRLIVMACSFGLGLIIGVLMATVSLGRTHGAAGIVGGIVGLIFELSYYIYFVGRFGATPGKMALGLKITRRDGTRLTYGRATGRIFAEMLSGLPTICIGYMMAGWDPEKRALHDRIADTRVIKTRS